MPGGISVVSQRLWSLRLFYQLHDGPIFQSVHLDGKWTHIHDHPIVTAVPLTPLAAINWNDGKEIRVYYLDCEYILQEYCYSEGKGWFAGEIGELKIRPSTNSRIGAVQYGDDEGGVHIRVYYQEVGSLVIAELCNDGYWSKGSLCLSNAVDGTSIAAVTYNWSDQTQIRIYYQHNDQSLREYCHDNSGWYSGEWNPGKVPGRSPINAVAFAVGNGGVQIQVFWRNLQDEIVTGKNTGSWEPATKVIGCVGSDFQFTVLQWEKGKFLRVYYKGQDNVVHEHCSDDGGKTWFPGSL